MPGLSVNVMSGPTLATTSTLPAVLASDLGSGSAQSAIQVLIISTLEIPVHLTDRSTKAKVDIRMAYAKYVALLNAIGSMSKLVTSGTWTHQAVTNDDIIEIFMSKSAYFKNHAKVFPMVNRYPLMERWLVNADDSPSDYEVWGYQKHTFDVLKSILSARPVPLPPLPAGTRGKAQVKSDSLSPPVEQRKKKLVVDKGKKRADDGDKKEKKKAGGSKKGSSSRTHHAHI